MAYRIQPADLATHQPIIEWLWSRNLRMRTEPRDKYRWYYCDNPLGSAAAFLLESSQDGRAEIVGSCGIGPRTLWVQGQPLRAGLLADFTVDREHRTVLPALLLQRAVAEYARATFELTYAYPNAAAVGIFRRIGYIELGQANRYVRLLRTGRFVRRVIKVRPLASLASLVTDTALRAADRVRALRGGRTQLEWVEAVDERWDRLFERVRPHHRIIGDRTAAFLRWRFLGRAGVTGRIAALTDSTGELRAYAAVTERDAGTALLADFLAEDENWLSILLARLVQALRKAGYEAILTYFLGAPAVVAALTSQGFRFRNAAKFIVVSAGASGCVQPDDLKNTNHWYLTEADRDN